MKAPVISRSHSTRNVVSVLKRLFLAGWIAVIPASEAAPTAGNATTEPDKSMTAAHDSFVKKDMDRAAEHLHGAAVWVKKESDNVSEKSKAGMKKCGDDLDKLGDDVKKGTVKSEKDLTACLSKTNHDIATCWHQTAAENKAAGKDATVALKHAGTSLEDAAKWSGTELKKGTKASVNAVKRTGEVTGKGIKAGADDVDRWFKDIGDGLKSLGHKD